MSQPPVVDVLKLAAERDRAVRMLEHEHAAGCQCLTSEPPCACTCGFLTGFTKDLAKRFFDAGVECAYDGQGPDAIDRWDCYFEELWSALPAAVQK